MINMYIISGFFCVCETIVYTVILFITLIYINTLVTLYIFATFFGNNKEYFD